MPQSNTSHLSVPELRKLCKQRGLLTDGIRYDLVNRLKAHKDGKSDIITPISPVASTSGRILTRSSALSEQHSLRSTTSKKQSRTSSAHVHQPIEEEFIVGQEYASAMRGLKRKQREVSASSASTTATGSVSTGLNKRGRKKKIPSDEKDPNVENIAQPSINIVPVKPTISDGFRYAAEEIALKSSDVLDVKPSNLIVQQQHDDKKEETTSVIILDDGTTSSNGSAEKEESDEEESEDNDEELVSNINSNIVEVEEEEEDESESFNAMDTAVSLPDDNSSFYEDISQQHHPHPFQDDDEGGEHISEINTYQHQQQREEQQDEEMGESEAEEGDTHTVGSESSDDVEFMDAMEEVEGATPAHITTAPTTTAAPTISAHTGIEIVEIPSTPMLPISQETYPSTLTIESAFLSSSASPVRSSNMTITSAQETYSNIVQNVSVPTSVPTAVATTPAVAKDGAMYTILSILNTRFANAVSGQGPPLSAAEYNMLKILLDDASGRAATPAAPKAIEIGPPSTSTSIQHIDEPTVIPTVSVPTILLPEIADDVLPVDEPSEIARKTQVALDIINQIGSTRKREATDDYALFSDSSEQPQLKKRSTSDFRFPILGGAPSLTPVATKSLLVPVPVPDNRPYVPVFQDNVAKFSSLVQPSPSAAGLSASKRRPLTLTDQRRRTATSASTSMVAKRILDTLSDLSGPFEQERRLPIPAVWRPNESTTTGTMNRQQMRSAPATALPSRTPVALSRREDLETDISYKTRTSLHSQYTNSSRPSISEGGRGLGEVGVKTVRKDPNKRLSFSTEVTVYDDISVEKEAMKTNYPTTSNDEGEAGGSGSGTADNEFHFPAPQFVNGTVDVPEEDEMTDASKSIKFVFSPPDSSRKKRHSAVVKPTSVMPTTTTTASVQSTGETKVTTTVQPQTQTQQSAVAPGVNPFSKYMTHDKIQCKVCLVYNEKGTVKCVSCESDIGTVASMGSAADSNKKKSAIGAAGMAGGVPSTSFTGFTPSAALGVQGGVSGFSFGSGHLPPPSIPAAPSGAVTSEGFSFSAAKPLVPAPSVGFSFGGTSSTGSVAPTVPTTSAPISSGFSFGGSTPSTTATTTAAIDVPALVPGLEEKKQEPAKPSGGFTFGTSTTAATGAGGATAAMPSFTTTTTTGILSSFPSRVEPPATAVLASTPLGGFKFGAPPAPLSVAGNGGGGGGMTTTGPFQSLGTATKTPAPTFSFGSTPVATTTTADATASTTATGEEQQTSAVSKKRSSADEDTTESSLKRIQPATSSFGGFGALGGVTPSQQPSSGFSFTGSSFGALPASSSTAGATTAASVSDANKPPMFSFPSIPAVSTGATTTTTSLSSVPSGPSFGGVAAASGTAAADASTLGGGGGGGVGGGAVMPLSFSLGATKPPLHSGLPPLSTSSFTTAGSTSQDKAADNLTPKVSKPTGYDTDSPGSTMSTMESGYVSATENGSGTGTSGAPTLNLPPPAASTNVFGFGGPSTTNTAAPTFGLQSSATFGAPSSLPFTSPFGTQNPATPAFGGSSVASGPFGAASNPAFGAGLGAAGAVQPPSFGTAGGTTFGVGAPLGVFGAPTPSAPTVPFTFGQQPSQVSGPAFGQSSALFGGSTTQGAGAGTSFNFAAPTVGGAVAGQGSFGQQSGFNMGTVDSKSQIAGRKKVKAKRP